LTLSEQLIPRPNQLLLIPVKGRILEKRVTVHKSERVRKNYFTLIDASLHGDYFI
jgi:hypothetical protein